MKKLMILAALAASTVAFADCEIPEAGPTGNCAEVYDVVLNVKTTECKCQQIKKKVTTSECGINTTQPGDPECVAWRQVVSKKVEGVIFSCYCSCVSEDANFANVLDGANFPPVIWNRLTTDAMEGNQYFWIAKDKIVLPETDLLNFKYIARIGKDKKTVEAAGTFGEGVYVAGTGTFDPANARVKNLSGSVAGVWTPTWDCADDDPEDGLEVCPAYQLCDATQAAAGMDTKTFVAGTFTVKYNASKSKALAKNRNSLWGKVVPTKVANYTLADWYASTAL